MPLRHLLLSGSLLLALASNLPAAMPPLGDPNYTGPSAPTVALPDLVLPESQPFVHPGLLQSQADIDFIRARIAAGQEPWTGALKAMRIHAYCKANLKPRIVPDIDPGGKNVGYLMLDSSAAYGNALLWCITGERPYADKAIEFLDAGATTLRSIAVGNNDQGKVEAGFNGGKYASAAELILHYRQPGGATANWPPADAERFKQMMTTVFYPLIENFKPEFNGNWDAVMVNTMLCIGVLCDDHAKFNRSLDYYLHGKGRGSISHYVHAGGQCQESARDQTHVQLGLGALASACEIASKQGLDLYGMAANRLAAGYEYSARYNCGYDVETVDEIPVSPAGRGRYMPIWEIAYQHYAVEKGIPMPYTKEFIEKHRPEGADLIILPAWGTLTAYRGPALPPAKAKTP